MKEIRDIVKAVHRLEREGRHTALLTVVSVRGSAYRRPGTRMLVSEKGQEVGSISTLCLESDLFEKAKHVIASEKPALISYDTTAPEDAIFGIGQGCAGKVKILIEPFTSQSKIFHLLNQVTEGRSTTTLTTIFHADGIYADLFATHYDHDLLATFPIQFRNVLQSDIHQTLEKKIAATRRYEEPNGSVEVLIEILRPPLRLTIFGATSDVIPLVSFASELGWYVILVDHRSAYATQENFPLADEIVVCPPDEVGTRIRLKPETFAVVMVHQFEAEKILLRTLLPSSVCYVGLLGPRNKRDLLLQYLAAEGFIPTAEQRRKLHNPIGLDVGAETAEEIALSIVAEIQAILTNRLPQHLKNKNGPIHQ